MKTLTYIASMLLAVVMLQIAPYIPHHHHDGAVCIVNNHCKDDGCKDDRHTSHSGDDTMCIENEEYLISKSHSWQDSLTPHFLPILVATLNQIVCGKMYPQGSTPRNQNRVAGYHSAIIATGRALRAPPQFAFFRDEVDS